MTRTELHGRVRLLLLALIGLGLGLAALLWFSIDGEELRVVRPAMEALPADAAIATGQMSELGAAVQRPLFWEGRKPVVATAAPVAEKASAAEGFKLLGIVVDHDKRTALLGTPQGVKRARPGDKVQGWSVEQVTPGRVTLSSAGKRVELSVAPPRHPGIRLGEPNAD